MSNYIFLDYFRDIVSTLVYIIIDLFFFYDYSGDVAYYDALSDIILSTGLVRPKTGVFQNHIKRLLVLTTATEIVVLGVCLVRSTENSK